MLLTIPGLLNAAQVAKIHDILQGAAFVDGRLSAGFAAARVKNNLELQADEQRHECRGRKNDDKAPVLKGKRAQPVNDRVGHLNLPFHATVMRACMPSWPGPQ